MSLEHVGHGDIVRFAEERVNLPRDKALEFRAQAKRLRDKLEGYLSEHPDFTLKKMMLSGSLAKGTALRSLNDVDVACYISGADVPSDVQALLDYLAARLRRAFPNFSPDQVQPQTYSVTVSFRGTGLDVDVVPILYSGEPDWYGRLVSQENGTYLHTCIPRHIEFIKMRKQRNETHFAQVVRLVKFWARLAKQERDGFRFKSFMIELILARLADQGANLSNYPDALQQFFTYIGRTRLTERIVFPDYYEPGKAAASGDRVQLFDPVNPLNNVGCLYTTANADAIFEASMDAGDAIAAARFATTKAETVRHWQKVFGPTFQG